MLPYQTMSRKEDGIAIVGVGGAGANILQCFGGSSADNVRLCIMSLDERVGRACGNVEFIQLGSGLNRGLGSGGDPEVGAHAALESQAQVASLIADSRLLVMVAGLGGGTGSGAAPVLARMAREAGLFLVSVLVMPFSFEGRRRREQAEKALEEVAALSDIVFCFENDYMEDLFRNRTGARAVFEEVDRLLAKATASVPTLANSPGLINLGLDELAAALENNDSRCLFGAGSGYGPNRAEDAARAALESPLVSYHNALRFARTVIVHIAGGDTMSLTEIRRTMETVRAALVDEDVRVFFGTTVKPKLGDEIRVSIIASINGEEFHTALLQEEAEAAEAAALAEVESAGVAEEEQEATPAPEQPEEEEVQQEIPTYAEEQQEEAAAEGESLYPDEEDEAPAYAPTPAPAYAAPTASYTAPAPAPQPHPVMPLPPTPPTPPAYHSAESEVPVPPAPQPHFPAQQPQPARQEEDEENPFSARHSLFSRHEVQAPLFQGELAGMMDSPAHTHHDADSAPMQRVIFPDELPESPEPVSRYAPEPHRRRVRSTSPADDLDTPPSLRSHNDLRDMF